MLEINKRALIWHWASWRTLLCPERDTSAQWALLDNKHCGVETIKKISPSREWHHNIPLHTCSLLCYKPWKKELQALVLNFVALLSHILWPTSTKLQSKNFHSANSKRLWQTVVLCHHLNDNRAIWRPLDAQAGLLSGQWQVL